MTTPITSKSSPIRTPRNLFAENDPEGVAFQCEVVLEVKQAAN